MTRAKWIWPIIIFISALASAEQPPAQKPMPNDAKSAVRALLTALIDENATEAMLLVEPENDSALESAQLFVRQVCSDFKLRRDALEKFGDVVVPIFVAEKLWGPDDWRSRVLNRIEEATETIEGDLTIVTIPDRMVSPWPTRDIGDRWKVFIPAPKQPNTEFRTIVKRTEEISADLQSGRISTPEQLREALSNRYIFVGAPKN